MIKTTSIITAIYILLNIAANWPIRDSYAFGYAILPHVAVVAVASLVLLAISSAVIREIGSKLRGKISLTGLAAPSSLAAFFAIQTNTLHPVIIASKLSSMPDCLILAGKCIALGLATSYIILGLSGSLYRWANQSKKPQPGLPGIKPGQFQR